MSNLSPQIITWPDENEKKIIEEHFLNNGFPNVIGAIDGTHIKIDKPERDAESYINRKGYYSVQVSIILLVFHGIIVLTFHIYISDASCV